MLLGIIADEFLKSPNPIMLVQLVTLLSLSVLDQEVNKCSIPQLFNGPDVLTSSKEKANRFTRKFSANSTLDDTLHSFPDFSQRTEQEISSMSITLRMVANAICELDVAKVTGADCILSIDLKMCFLCCTCLQK